MSDEPLDILVVDDNPEDRATYRRYLSRDTAQLYRIHEEGGVEAGLQALEHLDPACIILDYAMPDGTGLEFLQQLQSSACTRRLAVVMLTGTGDESIAVQAMKSGARDYLIKDQLTPESLRIALTGAIYRAAAERQLDAQRTELERLYREAQESNVAKDALVQQLQDANSAKDQFLATLSHELRTPLTPILIAVSAISEDELNEPMSDLFDTIRRNVLLEARLIDDLLDLTRVAKGKLQLDLQPTDVHAILQNVVEICRGDLESKSFLLELNLSAASRFVNADAARLQQVFWNLLKNAAKFTPLDGRISITTHSPAPDRIAISFADNGLGIPPERLSKIFDAFEQGSAAVTQRYGGLGLGLAISKAIVDAHHGSIDASSAGPNQGTTFTVELAAFAQAPAVELATPSPDGNYSANVLLVEDHLDTGRLLSRTLTRVGYRVHLATSIASALEVFRAEPIDLIVSDLGLPDGHGIELLEQASAIRPAKAIALSGYGLERDVEATRRAGFLMHLVKPIEPAMLQTAIERALSGALANEPTPV